MKATNIKFTWRDEDGTLHHESLELTIDHDVLDVVEISAVLEGIG